MNFGYTLLAGVLVLGGIGYWADRRWQTGPWLMIIGIFLGLAVSFKSLLADLDKAAAYDKAQKEKAAGDPKGRR